MRLASGPYSSYWNAFSLNVHVVLCVWWQDPLRPAPQIHTILSFNSWKHKVWHNCIHLWRMIHKLPFNAPYVITGGIMNHISEVLMGDSDGDHVIKGSLLDKLRQTLQILQTRKTLQTRGRQVSRHEQRNLTWKVSSTCTGVLNGGYSIFQMEAGFQTIILAKFSRKLHQSKIIGVRACLAAPWSANGTTRNSFKENV